MIEQALTDAGASFFCNKSGANLISGITAEFIDNATFGGRCKKDYALIECDEAAFNYPGNWVKQDYLPEKIKDQHYFTPEDTGKYERALAQRKETIDKLRNL